MATTLIVINVVGGTIALAAASVTSTPVGPTFPNHATYILGLFLVNGIHGVMHLLIGTLGLFVLARKIRAEYYLTGHTIWFGSLGVVGLVTTPELAPPHAILGPAINFPDHAAHLVLAAMSLMPFLVAAGRTIPPTPSSM